MKKNFDSIKIILRTGITVVTANPERCFHEDIIIKNAELIISENVLKVTGDRVFYDMFFDNTPEENINFDIYDKKYYEENCRTKGWKWFRRPFYYCPYKGIIKKIKTERFRLTTNCFRIIEENI